MIDWEETSKSLGFSTEKQMWTILHTSLRSIRAMAKYLNISTNTVRKRLQLYDITPGGRPGPQHVITTAESASRKLEKIPREEWATRSLKDIAQQVGCSSTFVHKFKKKHGL